MDPASIYQTTATLLASLSGIWLIFIGWVMATKPSRALAGLAAMGSTPPIHFGEMAIRTCAGLLLAAAAPTSRFPEALGLIGWFLVGSAIVLCLLPRRWHATYSRWWAATIPAFAVRVLAPVTIVAGVMLIWALN